MTENKWKSDKHDQAVGPSMEHKQPQASTQLSGHKQGGTNVSKGRSGVSRVNNSGHGCK